MAQGLDVDQGGWHPVAAIGISTTAALVLFVAVDFAISARLLPEPNVAVKPVPAKERPYVARADGWYELKRSFAGRDYWGTAIFPVHTDEFGFRTRDRDGGKSGPASVIFLGDSFAFGMNGEWADTFVGMYDLASPERILNAAVPSYSPTAYLHRYRQALEAQALTLPHTVVVALDISDVHDEAGVWVDGAAHPRNRRALQRDGGLVGEAKAASDPTWRGRIWDRLRFSQSIYQYLRYSVFGVPDPVVFDQTKSRFTWDEWPELDRTPGALAGFSPLGVQGGLERIRAKVAEIISMARDSGSRVYILIFPWPAQLQHTDRFSWSSFAHEICSAASCAGVIDTFPVFRRYAREHRRWYYDLYVPGDVHFNATGNRMIFDAIAAALGVRREDAQGDRRLTHVHAPRLRHEDGAGMTGLPRGSVDANTPNSPQRHRAAGSMASSEDG